MKPKTCEKKKLVDFNLSASDSSCEIENTRDDTDREKDIINGALTFVGSGSDLKWQVPIGPRCALDEEITNIHTQILPPPNMQSFASTTEDKFNDSPRNN